MLLLQSLLLLQLLRAIASGAAAADVTAVRGAVPC